MNLILIPFFLAANVVQEDTSKWTFGPEYTYNVNMTYVMRSDPMEPIGTIQLISTMKCRPKLSDILLCRMQNSTSTVLLANDNTTREIDTEHLFEIKFSRRGVQSLLIDSTPRNRYELVNLIRNIANQFSLGVDIKEKVDMSQFMSRENTSMGNCATMYKITREESQQDTIRKEDVGFEFVVSPIIDETSEAKSTFLTIEKSRIGCLNSPRYLDFVDGILKMGRFFSRIRINGINSFETYTELDGKLRAPNESMSSRVVTFKGILHVNLHGIKPAQEQLPLIYYGEPIDLNTNSDIPNNFID